MKRNILALAIPFCLCLSLAFSLKAQNYSDPDPELSQMKEHRANGRMPYMDIKNISSKLKAGTSLNADIGDAPAWSWVRTFGGSGGITFNDIAVDGSGNLYFLATFSDTVKILGNTFISQGMRDVIVVKISNLGTFSWGSHLKSSVEMNAYGKSIALGTGGKIYFTGSLDSSNAVTGSTITKIPSAEERIFVAGLDNNGTLLWLGFDTEFETIELHTDSKGDIYWMTSSVLHKLNSSGQVIRTKEIGNYLFDFEISGSKIWISGFVDEPGKTIAGHIFNPLHTSYAVFLVEMDTTGNYLQTEFLETSYYWEPYYSPASLELDSKGNIYLSGLLYDIYVNGSQIINESGNYLFKLNENLQLVWALNDDSGNIYAVGMIKSGDNRFYEYGEYYLSKNYNFISIGDTTVFPDAETGYGYYLAEVDSSGKVLRINIYNGMSGNFIVKSPDLLYRTYTNYFQAGFEKATLDGGQFWKSEIDNTGGGASFLYTMDIDIDGNLYAQGYYRGNVRIINKTLTGTGIMFVKFDNDGNLAWWRNMESPDGISSGIKVDVDGNVYAWGSFNGYIKISGQEYISESGDDIYFIKLDKDGDLKFVKQFEGTNTLFGTGAIDVDRAGDIIIAGTFTDTLKLGSYKLVAYKSYDVFITKINPNGNVVWARSYKGKSTDWGRSVTVDERDNIYFTGYYRDSITFDKVVLNKTSTGYDMFMVKLDPKANIIWAKGGGPANRYIRGISIVAKDENLYVQGVATGTGPLYFDSGNVTLMSEFPNNSFLARYDTDGEIQWVKLMKANKYNWSLYRIDADTAENVYIGGIFEDTLIVEGNLIAGSEGRNYYVAKYDIEGNLIWLKTSEQSNTGDIQLISVKVFDKDVVLVAGSVTDGIVQIGQQRIVTAGTSSFAGLIGKAIVGCVINLDMNIENTIHGDSTGSAVVNIIGGSPPYDITWSNGLKDYGVNTASASITNQPAGIYQVYLEDSKGCIQYREFAINDLNGPMIILDSISDVSCAGYANGYINISVTGGTPFSGGSSPYLYFWSNGTKTEDIFNLVAAPYEIQVKDANGYVAYQGFSVNEPKPLNIAYDLYSASCSGGTDGRINLFVSGGTKPYSYVWTGGWMTDDMTEISAGVYEVTVTDHNQCESSAKIALSEEGSSIVETDSVINAHCNIPDGKITINVLDSIGGLSYKWNTGETTPTLSNVKGEKDYFVNVTNQAGCKTVHKVTVGLILPQENPICIVTVDTSTSTNLVVWEKVADAEMYYVFRETTEKDKYILAGSVPGDALSVFTDSIADPHIRAYRYKIAAVDECGSVSFMSTFHKTVHLRVYPELNTDNIILAWDDYAGEDVASFEVWRHSSVFGWELLETLPANLFSYIDINVPPGTVKYIVRVPIPEACYPAGNPKAGSGPYSQSMSNMEDNRFLTGNAEIKMKSSFFLYPNPTTGKCILWSETIDLKEAEIKVLDLQGRVVYSDRQDNIQDGRISIDLTGQAPGSYFVKVKSGVYNMFNKLIIQ